MNPAKDLDGHEAILRFIQSTPLGSDPTLRIPPSSFTELKGRFLHYAPRRRLSMEFPFDERFLNPTGGYQGGMLAALVDNGFGFLSYLAAGRPCVTLNLHLAFIRGFSREDVSVIVDTTVLSRSQNLMTLEAVVQSQKEKLVATAVSQLQIVKRE